MADEDTVFVECNDGVLDGREGSIEIIQNNSGDNSEVTEEDKSGCEREDIVQASQAVKQVKDAIQYHDDGSLQVALDKVRARERIDAEFQEKIAILQRIANTESYSHFHDIVAEVLKQLVEAENCAKQGKTSLSRPIEILNDVLPIFEEACSAYTEKIFPSTQVQVILQKIDEIKNELKECENIENANVKRAKELEKMSEKMFEQAVEVAHADVERVTEKIRVEEEADNLAKFKSARNSTNENTNFLTRDFEQMKNHCADDIQLTESTLHIQIASKEGAFEKFEAKDKELDEKIKIEIDKEEELRRQLEEVLVNRRSLEEDKEHRRAVQNNADVVHKQTIDELQELLGNLSDLKAKVDTASVVLNKTRDVCILLFNKAIESKTVQQQDMKHTLLMSKTNLHTALLAQGVNCLSIKERENGALEMLREKVKKKETKFHNSLKHHMESESKKLSERIRTLTVDKEQCKKNLRKVESKLEATNQDINAVQRDLDEAGANYSTLDQAYIEYKKHYKDDDGGSLISMA